jgi:geranylgeranyl pyrophosphate synthase
MDFPTFPKNWRKEKDKKDDIKLKNENENENEKQWRKIRDLIKLYNAIMKARSELENV